MEFYKMYWGDIVRMSTPDFRIPPNTIKVIEFSPLKKKYKEKINNSKVLRDAMVASFMASSEKFIVRKWILTEVGELPNVMKSAKQKRTRINIEFIRKEVEVVEEVIKEIVEEVIETEEIIKEERSETWQQLSE